MFGNLTFHNFSVNNKNNKAILSSTSIKRTVRVKYFSDRKISYINGKYYVSSLQPFLLGRLWLYCNWQVKFIVVLWSKLHSQKQLVKGRYARYMTTHIKDLKLMLKPDVWKLQIRTKEGFCIMRQLKCFFGSQMMHYWKWSCVLHLSNLFPCVAFVESDNRSRSSYCSADSVQWICHV